MERLRLRTLGLPRLEGPTGVLIAGVRTRELALLAYLARHAPRRIEREHLATAFWGEREESKARHSLRQVLFQLRRVVGAELDVTVDSVGLAPGVELDAAEFEADVAAGRFAQAVERYEGPFLQGADDGGGEAFRTWLETERARLARQLGFALARLVEESEARREWTEAARWAEHWADFFPFDEAPVVRLLEALDRQGRHAEALARRDAFMIRLREELGVEPSDAVLRAGPQANGFAVVRRPASAALLGPDLVGREAPLAALDSLWRDIAERGAGVVVEGEAGIGKTRLIREFAQRAASLPGGALLLSVRFEGDEQSAPFAAVRRLMAPLRHASGLSGASDRSLARLSEVLPSLRERFPRLPEPDGLDGRLDEALSEVLGTVGQEKPVLLLADDFPRLDEPTRVLLLSLIRSPPKSVLIGLTARTDELRALGHASGLADSPVVARLKLQPLDLAQTERLVASMIELAFAEQRRALALRVHAESGGLPFFAVEFVSALADSGVLALDAGGRWQIVGDLDVMLPLPATIEEAIEQRLARLSPAARAALEAAAVIGRHVDAAMLERVAALPTDVLSAATSELVARRLLRSVPDHTPAYEFSHELIRRAAYEQIPVGRRQALHAAALAGLDELATDDAETARERAYHRERAGRAAPRRRRVIVMATIALALSAAATWIALGRGSGGPPAELQPRVIVLPFENLTGDPQLGPVARIAADWISQAIARTALVKVAPPPEDLLEPDGATRFGSPDRVLERARQAGASIVVRGSYQNVGDSLRLLAEVLDVATTQVLAVTTPITGSPRDPMPAIDGLRERVLVAIAPWVDPRIASAAAVQSSPPSYTAYRAFAEGLDHVYARRGELALSHLFRAYALDTSYTLPLLHAVVVHEGHRDLHAADSLLQILLPRRGELAPYDRAILDYELAMVQNDRQRMYVAAQRAADIAPGSLLAVYHLPRAAMALNLPKRSIDLLTSVDPDRGAARGLTGYWNVLAHALHMAGEYERQLTVAHEVRRRFPQEHRAFYYLANALAALGRLDELDAVLEESWLLASIPEFGPPGFALHVTVAQELAAHAHAEQAQAVLKRARRFHESSPPELMRIARHAAAVAQMFYLLHRLDEARVLLEPLTLEPVVSGAAWGMLGLVAVLQGDTSRAAEIERQLRDFARDSPYPDDKTGSLVSLARMAALEQRPEDAVGLLRQAVAAGLPYDSGIHVIWEFASLRGYPPFDEWLRPKG